MSNIGKRGNALFNASKSDGFSTSIAFSRSLRAISSKGKSSSTEATTGSLGVGGDYVDGVVTPCPTLLPTISELMSRG